MYRSFQLAKDRFNIITKIIGDAQASLIATVFYFTVLLPFGIGSALLSDPLRKRSPHSATPVWLERAPVATDLDQAKQQG